jgi:hypothetical protein
MKLALMGGHDVDLGPQPTDPGGPVLHVGLISIMGGELRRAGSAADRLPAWRPRRRHRR